MEQITTMKELNIFIQEFDNYSFNSDNSTVFFSSSYSHYADQELRVEGEALEFLLKEEAEEEAERKNRQTPEEKEWEAAEKARLYKNKNGGLFEFRCFAKNREWFVYQIQADSLDDAERIGWELLAKDTAHWKRCADRRNCYHWDCE